MNSARKGVEGPVSGLGSLLRSSSELPSSWTLVQPPQRCLTFSIARSILGAFLLVALSIPSLNDILCLLKVVFERVHLLLGLTFLLHEQPSQLLLFL